MLKVDSIDITLSRAGFVLYLNLSKGGPYLPIIVGLAEAHSITLAQNGIKPQRPLSHDLMSSILHHFDATLIKVVINNFKKGTYYAVIHLSTKDGEKAIDCRPSDAIALALRTKSPVYITENVMDAQTTGTEKHIKPPNDELSDLDLLKEQLDRAIQEERYEEAALLRDQINGYHKLKLD